MILHFEEGRMGNQLFQYMGLKKYFPNEKIIYFGCDSLRECFENLDGYFLSLKAIKKKISFGILYYIVKFLKNIYIFGVIEEDKYSSSKNYKISVRRGVVWWIFVTHKIHFQHKEFLNKIQNPPSLKKNLKKQSINWLKKKGINLKKDRIVFVHIRRGDYLRWPSLAISGTKNYPAVLDLKWYQRAMNLIKKKINNPKFIIMSDDQYYVKDFFKESDKILISLNEPEIDLSIMSFCSSGIMSASSFAWWGAYYAKILSSKKKIFIAPKYWGGYRYKKWWPKNFQTRWITYYE